MKISLENLLPDIGALSVVTKNLIYLYAHKRGKRGKASDQSKKQNKTKQNKTTKSTHKKSKLKIHNRGHTFKRKKHGELHIQL